MTVAVLGVYQPLKAGVAMEPEDSAASGLAPELPTWSIGLQAASLGNTGVTLQKAAIFGGAMNATFGLGYWEPVLIVDYLRFFDESLRPHPLVDAEAVGKSRGLLLPYMGLGMQGGQGFGVRVSTGIQYTMLEDPVSFFGSATILIGPCDCDPYVFKVGSVFFGMGFGVRVMLYQ